MKEKLYEVMAMDLILLELEESLEKFAEESEKVDSI